MAARKSCTKLTWAEAKEKSGVGGSKNPNKAGLKASQQPNHGKLLAAKIIAKGAPDEGQRIKNRQAARMARRDELRQGELDRKRELEKEQKRLEDTAKPHEKAMEKLRELEEIFHQKLLNKKSNGDDTALENDHGNEHEDDDDQDRRNLVCESKQLQLDEVLALEAIYADIDTLKVSEISQVQDLQAKLEDWQDNPDQIDLQTAIVKHPGISYTLKRSFEDPEDGDRVAHMLLHIEYQNDYPLERTPPIIRIVWCLVTRKSLVVSSNKPLESLGIFDEVGLIKSMKDEAEEFLLGMPSVYELLDSWLSEHLFEYIQACPTRDKN
mmetsp:Transcript_23163/g.50621  ORF Transcript_23163/g.50621 Transcript_23163/m.50621 type:complete len:324 (-) Transcript_23163:483-1454(-)